MTNYRRLQHMTLEARAAYLGIAETEATMLMVFKLKQAARELLFCPREVETRERGEGEACGEAAEIEGKGCTECRMRWLLADRELEAQQRAKRKRRKKKTDDL